MDLSISTMVTQTASAPSRRRLSARAGKINTLVPFEHFEHRRCALEAKTEAKQTLQSVDGLDQHIHFTVDGMNPDPAERLCLNIGMAA